MKKNHKAFITIFIIVCCMAPVANAQISSSGADSMKENKYLPYDDVGYFNEGLASFCNYDEEQNFCGFLDRNGEVVIPAQYESVTYFYEGLAGVSVDGKWGYIDRRGQMVIQPQYDEVAIPIKDGVIQVMKNDKWGYIDKTGKELVALQYDDINNFGEGLAHVRQNGQYGYINKAGEFVIQPQYAAAFPFTEGLAAVSVNEKWGFIDKRNQVVIPYRYDYVYPFTFGLAAVEVDGKWGFIDHTGKEIVTPQYSYVSYFKDGLAEVLGMNGLFGFIDRTGKEVIKPQYYTVSAFSDGLALVSVRDEYGFPVQGYINKNNQRVIGFNSEDFHFTGGAPFENGKGVVSDDGEGTYYIIDKPSVKMNVHLVTFRLMVDGEPENVRVFEIDGNTYIKLRDLAMALNNTNKSFEIDYNHESEMIYLTTRKRYTPVSGDLAMNLFDKQTIATESDIAIEINGDYLTMYAYSIQGNNYFRISEIAQALNVGINEDPNGRVIKIDTSSEFLSKMNGYSWGW